MKKILLILSLLQVVISSCDQDIDFPFEGKNRIHFEHFTNPAGERIYYDNQTISLGLLNDTIEYDTARVVVQLLGKTATNVDRKYKIKIHADSTTAVEGIHYERFDEIQTFRAGRIDDTLKIVVIRKNLSTSFRYPQDKSLYLKIEESEDFGHGLSGGLTMKLVLNNYLSEPKWWFRKFMGDLYYYHPVKWKVLIGFNEAFANYNDVPFDTNSVGGIQYRRDLEKYLNNVPCYDDETGERVLMRELKMEEK